MECQQQGCDPTDRLSLPDMQRKIPKDNKELKTGRKSTQTEKEQSKIMSNDRKNIFYKIAMNYKSLNRAGRVLMVLLALAAVAAVILAAQAVVKKSAPGTMETEPLNKVFVAVVAAPDIEGVKPGPTELELMTNAGAARATLEKRYNLTDDERWEIASVITAEAQGEPYEGKIAVAQCILQACEDDGIRPAEVFEKYKYYTARPKPCPDAVSAVVDVFDHGKIATADPIKYFYAPAGCYSSWHESQEFVVQIHGHRFFKEKESK